MKLIWFIISLAFFIVSCGEEYTVAATRKLDGSLINDTSLPIITVLWKKRDTVCLTTSYEEPGAEVYDKRRNYLNIKANVTGTVNTNLAGTYLLNYDYTNADGKKAVTMTRTVDVIENSTAFLNGIYNVACTCTLIAKGTRKATLTTSNYIANITPASKDNGCNINEMKVGDINVKPFTFLKSNFIEVSFFSRDLHPISISSGTLAASKKTFTIESEAVRLYPDKYYGTRYKCKNVFTNSKVE